MKKHIIGKVITALIILAASSYFINLQAQDVTVEFTNPDGQSYGSSNDGLFGVGIGGSGSGATDDGDAFAVDNPHVELLFKIGVAGQIELVAKTPTTYGPSVTAVTSWNSTSPSILDNLIAPGSSTIECSTSSISNIRLAEAMPCWRML